MRKRTDGAKNGRYFVAYDIHASGPPVVFGRPGDTAADKRLAKCTRPRRMGRDLATFEPYADVEAFERQQMNNGHLDAEVSILERLMSYVGDTVVSLACGSGYADRELVKLRTERLKRDEGSRLMLLGVDSSPVCVDYARREMNELLESNPALKEIHKEGRFNFQYERAMLGETASTTYKEERVTIPDFAGMNLRHTVIGDRCPATFIAFMAFVLWIDNKEAAIKSIADKCRKGSKDSRPTALINGEEFPTHITPSELMAMRFEHAVHERKSGEVPPDRLWNHEFPKYGLVKMTGGDFLMGPEWDHIMHYAALLYYGTND